MPLLLLLGLLAGCAVKEPRISRFDGQPVAKPALEQAKVECDAKAYLATTTVTQPGGLKRAVTQEAAYTGCMAEKGFRVE